MITVEHPLTKQRTTRNISFFKKFTPQTKPPKEVDRNINYEQKGKNLGMPIRKKYPLRSQRNNLD